MIALLALGFGAAVALVALHRLLPGRLGEARPVVTATIVAALVVLTVALCPPTLLDLATGFVLLLVPAAFVVLPLHPATVRREI